MMTTVAASEPVETVDTVPTPPDGDAWRRWARRVVFVGLIALQLAMVVRAYDAPHKEFGFQMFPEASEWRADIVRVTSDGERIPIDEPWYGYEWNELVSGRGLGSPWRRHHADAGVDNQLAFLDEALTPPPTTSKRT